MEVKAKSPLCTLTFHFIVDTVEKMLHDKHVESSRNHQTIAAFSPLPLVYLLHFHHSERSRHLTLPLNPNVSSSRSCTRACFM